MTQKEDEAWDSQREAMYNGWAKSKIFITPLKYQDADGVTVSVLHNGIKYSETCLQIDCFASADPYNIAWNRLQVKLHNVDKNIELNY
jgi:hypothetical protein